MSVQKNIILSQNGQQIPRSQITGKSDGFSFPQSTPQQGISGLSNISPSNIDNKKNPSPPPNNNIRKDPSVVSPQIKLPNASGQNKDNKISTPPKNQNLNTQIKISQPINLQPQQQKNQFFQANFQPNIQQNQQYQQANQNLQQNFRPNQQFNQQNQNQQNQQINSQQNIQISQSNQSIQNSPNFNANMNFKNATSTNQNQITSQTNLISNNQTERMVSRGQNPVVLPFNTQPPKAQKQFQGVMQGTIAAQKQGGSIIGKSRLSGKYDRSYNAESRYDIINTYFQITQFPEQTSDDAIQKISKALVQLIGIQKKPSIQQRNPLQKIEIAQIQGVQEPYHTKLKQFWYLAMKQFVKSHPYCTQEGTLNLIKYHIKQNNKTYYPFGQFNLDLFNDNEIVKDNQINVNSAFFIKIQKSLQNLLSFFLNHFQAIIKAIPQAMWSNRILSFESIAKNIWQAFKTIYNPDYILDNNNIHAQIGFNLITMLLALHKMNSALFKSIAIDFIKNIDDKIHLICHDYDVSRLNSQDKSLSTNIGKKCVKLANLLLLNFPFEYHKWDRGIKDVIKNIKSYTLYPFKWLLIQDGIINNKNSKFKFFSITGVQWFHLLKDLIKNYENYPYLQQNQPYKQIIFFLICSIIEQNPVNFWTNSQQFNIIYDYIKNIYRSIQYSKRYQHQIGRLCRIMICACGKSTLDLKNSRIPEQLLRKFTQDTIMLRVDGNGQSSNEINLSTLLLDHFCSNILQGQNIYKSKLFGYFLEVLIQVKDIKMVQITFFQGNQSIRNRYHYQQSFLVIYELLQQMVTQNPNLIPVFIQFWNAKCTQIKKQQSKIQAWVEFLDEITFKFLQKLQDYIENIIKQMHLNQIRQKEEYRIIPRTFQLINQLIKKQPFRQVAFYYLFQYIFKQTRKINYVLQRSMIFYQSAEALVKNVQYLYEYMYQYMQNYPDKKGPWVNNVCRPIIENLIGEWDQLTRRHFANITRIVIYKKCLSEKLNPNLSVSKLISLDAQSKIVNNLADSKGNDIIKINQLKQYSNHLLEYIIWALKVQQDTFRQFHFYNTLYMNRKYDSLQAALKLLEVLIVAFMKYQHFIDFPENMRKFLLVCQPTNNINISLSSADNISRNPQVALANKKIASLPAVLAYLVCNPMISKTSQIKSHQLPIAKEIRCMALNILNMIITNNTNTFGIYTSLQRNNIDFTSIVQQDPISRVDFNIYQCFFINDYQKVYCSAKQFLIDFVRDQICQNNKIISLAPISWFQSTYNYGQLIDTLTQISTLYNSPVIINAIQERIKVQRLNGDNLALRVRKFLDKSDPLATHLGFYNKGTMSSDLMNYLCDREVAALSRYALLLTLFYNPSSQKAVESQKHFFNVTQVVINKLLNMIIQQPECRVKSTVVVAISSNIWKMVRVLQAKKDLRIYGQFLKKYMPFILNYYHMDMQDAEYIREYMVSIRLVLSLKQYMDITVIQQIEKLKQMLIHLMEEAAKRPKYYIILLYTLNLFTQLFGTQSQNAQRTLKMIYLSVQQTINPLLSSQNRNNLRELSQDISVICLMMFFRQHLNKQLLIRNQRDKSTYQLLIQDYQNPQLSGFNFKSLLLNCQNIVTQRSLQMAIKICRGQGHFVQFISAFNHIYKGLTEPENYLSENNHRIVRQILKMIKSIFDSLKKVQNQQIWRNLAFKVSWACNLLYVMVGYNNSRSLLKEISQILFNHINLLSLLGQLLLSYAEYPIKWPYFNIKIMNKSTMGLLDKQLLLSILKVYSIVVSKYDQWVKTNLYGSQDPIKNNTFFTFCRSVVSAARILSMKVKSKPLTQYEQTLQKIPLKFLYKTNMNLRRNTMSISEELIVNQMFSRSISDSQMTTVKQVFSSSCQNALDLFHDHFNLLISQKYLMLLLGCYRNPSLILESYQFKDLISNFGLVSNRLIKISSSPNVFEINMQNITEKYWNCYRLNTNLYYLNTIQQSPKDQLEILNSVAEFSVKCIVTLRQVMQMHQDSRQFNLQAQRAMKQVYKYRNSNAFRFELQKDLKQGGFETRSQYGASFMNSPSIKIKR